MKGIKFLTLTLFVLILVSMLSCIPNQEETKKLKQKVADLDGKVVKLSSSYDEINTTLSNLQVDIVDMKKQIASLKSTVDTEMAKITKEHEEKLNQVIADYEKKQKGKIQAQAKSSETTKPPAGTIKKEEARPIVKGKYYKVKEGETVAEIARKFGVAESKIRKENGLPKGIEPFANQNLFIPAK